MCSEILAQLIANGSRIINLEIPNQDFPNLSYHDNKVMCFFTSDIRGCSDLAQFKSPGRIQDDGTQASAS